ncbi:lactoylglutathione lyase [Gracilibacillus orientalis]|uniref:Lactoylglutathione lyase n=1 Tax=Gracilibacillus orientalis TaxID=334253 RepID=A0A1I4MV66_9BACI|nr:VOC family protein [Gracilibacillus orientalis]SFM06987.1 lactoylglutathione lyase [Gracilibacillus orientalis]
MIKALGQVMLYVNNQEEAVTFWTERLGFTVIANEDGQGMKWIEVAPSKDSETSIVIHDKKLIAEMNLDTPSLMFFSENLNALYEELKSKGVTVGELVDMPNGSVFNFADDEDNYFAVMEKG